MLFSLAFFLNAAANFVFAIAVSAILGPAEFGRYATAALAAITLAGATLDWLRYATLRYSGERDAQDRIASSLEAGYLGMTLFAYAGVGIAVLLGKTFGLGAALLALTPLLAVAAHRVDFTGAKFRARDQEGAFVAIYGLRQIICFTLVLVVAAWTRDATLTIAALCVANLAPALVFSMRYRTPGARIAKASRAHLMQFFVYAKPIVASMVIYQAISLINRQVALAHLGAAATGELSFATDLGQRLFQTVNSLPELVLFQLALRVDREAGRAAAERQLAVNVTIVFALLAPLAAGYVAMGPTFEAILVPPAYRGDFARLSVELTPGFFAYCAMISAINPIFQLAQRTWPVIVAALCALAAELALLAFGGVAESIDSLAWAYSASLCVGLAITLVLAFASSGARPPLRDVIVILATSALIAIVVRPLNDLSSRPLAAALALVVGGAILGAALLAFDVAGARAYVAAHRRELPALWRRSPQRHATGPAHLANGAVETRS